MNQNSRKSNNNNKKKLVPNESDEPTLTIQLVISNFLEQLRSPAPNPSLKHETHYDTNPKAEQTYLCTCPERNHSPAKRKNI